MVVGGFFVDGDGLVIYRGDFFICGFVIYVGVILDVIGGCGVVCLVGF